jgi:hypothetical protein
MIPYIVTTARIDRVCGILNNLWYLNRKLLLGEIIRSLDALKLIILNKTGR